MVAKYVLVDRDGVLNADRPDSVRTPAELRLLPRAGRAVAQLNALGYRVVVVTNQACVGRGDLSEEMLEHIHDVLRRRIAAQGGAIERIYVCPHLPEVRCDCRKPAPGLLLKARRDLDLDLSATWFVGDSERDLLAAAAAGCRPALVRTGKGARTKPSRAVPIFRDLLSFADYLGECDTPS